MEKPKSFSEYLAMSTADKMHLINEAIESRTTPPTVADPVNFAERNTAGDWPDESKYLHDCECGITFLGHKGRVVCRVCDAPVADPQAAANHDAIVREMLDTSDEAEIGLIGHDADSQFRRLASAYQINADDLDAAQADLAEAVALLRMATKKAKYCPICHDQRCRPDCRLAAFLARHGEATPS